MRYEELNEELMLHFPEFQSIYKEQFDFWEDTPPQHCFYAAILNKFIANLLLENKEKVTIFKVFNFYEKMAQSDDIEVINLLQVTLLEYLWDNKIIFERACQYMFPKTKEINNLIGNYLRVPIAQTQPRRGGQIGCQRYSL